MYVREGEAFLRNTFHIARVAAPSIIFIDEFDVVGAKRGGSLSNSSIVVGERILFTLLTEMDGSEEAKGVFVLAAANIPCAIDSALLLPGRFDLAKNLMLLFFYFVVVSLGQVWNLHYFEKQFSETWKIFSLYKDFSSTKCRTNPTPMYTSQ
ncbi:unnamed protein product [Prunus armeniaca]|uniref:ATPase AAA-type core domain-containing protein n=1 Tax=Prunus armeniaca TaxID=36596 RepID=A0A6J5VWJ9_PRUAR|nr:unnamed protein product [Prunus armeniaca]